MEKYNALTLLLITVLLGSCQQYTMKGYTANRSTKTMLTASHHVSEQKEGGGQMITLIQSEYGKKGIQLVTDGSYELLITHYPKKAKQLLISIAMTSSDYKDSGYLTLTDRRGNLGIGIDFSWSKIHLYQNEAAFVKGLNDQVTLTILIDQDKGAYALMAQNNRSEEIFRTKSKPFLHPAFTAPHKLEFAVKGNYMLEQVTLHNI